MLTRTIDLMREHDVDIVVGSSPASLADLAEYRNWIDPVFKEYMMRPGASSELQQALVVLTIEGEVTLLVSADMAANAAGSNADRIVLWGSSEGVPHILPTGFEAIADALTHIRHVTRTDALDAVLDRTGTTVRVGVERESLTPGAWEALTAGNDNVGDCSDLLRLGRMVKTSEQIDLLQRAAEAAEYAATETLAIASVGSNWRELSDLYRLKLAEHGAELDHFSGSPTGFGQATHTDFRLPESGSMYFDHGCRLRSWFSDTGHTIAFGPPDEECLRRQVTLQNALLAGAEHLSPGRPASAAAIAMNGVLTPAGLKGFPHGHGIGLEVRDYPILVPDNGLLIRDDFVSRPADLPLEIGMVINLESAIWASGTSSVHIERSFVIEGSGCRPLSDQPRDEPISISSGT